jgi:hypothetical protein
MPSACVVLVVLAVAVLGFFLFRYVRNRHSEQKQAWVPLSPSSKCAVSHSQASGLIETGFALYETAVGSAASSSGLFSSDPVVEAFSNAAAAAQRGDNLGVAAALADPTGAVARTLAVATSSIQGNALPGQTTPMAASEQYVRLMLIQQVQALVTLLARA